MANGFYLILAIAVALVSIFYGFWKGISGQLAALLGFAFGVVAARVLTPEYHDHFNNISSILVEEPYEELAAHTFCAAAIYIVTFLLFCLFTPILRGALSIFDVGILNRIAGGIFSLTANLLLLSIFYTLLLCINPNCGLLKYEKSDDGNLAAAIMDMTPAFLGCQGADEIAHLVQLQQAATISCNFNPSQNVIISGDSLIYFDKNFNYVKNT